MKNVKNSKGVNWSNGVNCSKGVNESDGVNWSDGVNRSNGVDESNGVSWSYGVKDCYGVSKAIFLTNKPQQATVFGKDVSDERFEKVWEGLNSRLDGWFPKFNNAFELYLQNGNYWAKVDASQIKSTTNKNKPYEAWKTMPKEAIEYLKNLPEFNADIFKEVTGIDVKPKEVTKGEEIEIDGKQVSKETVKQALKEYFSN